jgi:hypothetical protein
MEKPQRFNSLLEMQEDLALEKKNKALNILKKLEKFLGYRDYQFFKIFPQKRFLKLKIWVQRN